MPNVTANGVDFSYLEWGPADGPLALLLHGFPDSAHTWRFLGPALAERGLHAVAPFLRGYAPTSIPADGRYQSGALALDACRLHEALGGDGDAVIVGHDWGAMATYGAAAYEPDRWRRVVASAVPPAGSMAAGFLSYEQLRRSWYMFFFQSPLADIAVPMDDLRYIDRLWADWSPGYDAAEDLELLKPSLRDPANLAAALGYYRVTLGTVPQAEELADVQAATQLPPPQPTLYLHGDNDGCLGIDLAANAKDFLPAEGSRMEIVPGAGHFSHVEKPDLVNGLIADFVSTT
jgi:pimeloyl-ACP methyl ester carboxylesterase